MPGLTLATPISTPIDSSPRKRTMSFSGPQSSKAARALNRTASYISLADAQHSDQYTLKVSSSSSHRHEASPYPRPPRQPKEHRERRKSVPRPVSQSEPLTIHIKPRSPQPKPAMLPMYGLRTSSPLAPTRSLLPPRATFPRSKHEPDLYRVAIIGRMRTSAEGQKILHMGPRLALSIYTATQELERMVASHRDSDGDINMSGGGEQLLSTSWVVVPQDDWEMVDQ